MGERFGSAVSRFRERKGKAENQKKNHMGVERLQEHGKYFQVQT